MAEDWSARFIIESLRSGQSVVFRARGRSMWPTISSRSRIEVTPCAGSALTTGEIAAFERAGRVLVHRVLGVDGAGVVFGGDSRDATDGHIAHEQVLGRARVVEPRRLRWRLPALRHVVWLCRALSRRAALRGASRAAK